MRVLFAGGGTGGHVIPAIAVAEALLREDPMSEVLFVGAAKGIEERLVPAAGFPLELLSVGKLQGTRWISRLRTLGGLPPALLRAIQIARTFNPHVVVGVGGYASAPMALAARTLGLPLVLLEQNAVPGATNRVLARLAQRVVTSFVATPGLPRRRVAFLGNPLRPALVERLEAASRTYGAGRDRPSRLLIFGGSQGAHHLNELALAVAPRLASSIPSGIEIVHQTGEADERHAKEAYADAGIKAHVAAFFDETMPEHYAWADLALCRSGATTVAELCVASLPAILVPYPHAANDHQAANAREAVEAGGATMIREADLDPDHLHTTLQNLLSDRLRLSHMGRAMRSCARPRAAARVVALLREIAQGD